MRRVLIGIFLSLISGPVLADWCGDREAQTVFHCQFQNSTRVVHVCLHEDDSFHYAYGKPGRTPELEMRHPKDRVVYTPWNGIGSAFWARLAFHNQSHSYEVGYSALKDGSAPVEGYLDVFERGQENPIATKVCRPGTVETRLEELYDLFS